MKGENDIDRKRERKLREEACRRQGGEGLSCTGGVGWLTELGGDEF